MNIKDYILLGIIIVAVIAAFRYVIKNKKNGGCCGCSGNCGECHKTKNKK